MNTDRTTISMTHASTPLVSLDAIREAHIAVAPRIHRTPVMGSTYLGMRAGARVVLKLELFQKTGSFKVRGVLNTLRQLTDDERARGVISLSAGNHAQALAWGASQYGVAVTIVMPATALASKVAATREYGGTVIQTDGDLLATALELQRERELTLVHPFDDLRVIAGQGTVGLEILEQVPNATVVVIACGGGGLISGVAAAIKQSRPDIRIVGVEPAGADAMTRSLAAGSPQRLAAMNTIADGLAAPFVGVHTLAHCQAFVDEWHVVPDDEIVLGMRALMERCKLFPETAAGAAIVPLLTNRLSLQASDVVVPIVCGGNIDIERMKSLL